MNKGAQATSISTQIRKLLHLPSNEIARQLGCHPAYYVPYASGPPVMAPRSCVQAISDII
jgi:hypothetical protein